MPLALLVTFALAQSPLSSFEGRWQLDAARSDDLAPLAKALGFPSMLLKLASKKPVQQLRLAEGALEVSGDGPLGHHSERFPIDGQATDGELLGVPFHVTSTLVDGTLESTGSIELRGKAEHFVLRRSVEGASMHLVITVGALTVHRFFTRL